MSDNELVYKQEFEEVIGNYKISDEGQKLLKKLKFVALLAPSSSGRNTVIKQLIKTGHYRFIISDTTRKPRVNDGVLEQDGVEYNFRTEKEVLEELKRGDFLEAEIIHQQQVSGVSLNELKKAADENKIAITDMDLLGAKFIHEVKYDSLVILLVPPTFDTWMKRMEKRGKMSPIEKTRRLKSAQAILEFGLTHQYFTLMVNDDIKKCVNAIDDYILRGARDLTEVKIAQETTEQLLEDLNDYLESH